MRLATEQEVQAAVITLNETFKGRAVFLYTANEDGAPSFVVEGNSTPGHDSQGEAFTALLALRRQYDNITVGF
jgi:hypothetical protein